MGEYSDKSAENKSTIVSNQVLQQHKPQAASQFADRPEAIVQMKLQDIANNSTRVLQLSALQQLADSHSGESIQRKTNNTGLPDNLKSNVENLSGYNMDDVKVHYNSAKPVQLQALAYAQGADIHLGPGQERHLPHEAWHVVQQKQGRVQPTLQMKGGVEVNDDKELEMEADVMGAKAIQLKSGQELMSSKSGLASNIVQRYWSDAAHPGVRISQGNGMILVNDRSLYAKAANIGAANALLIAAGAIVTLNVGEAHEFATGSYYKVVLGINAAAVNGAVAQRLAGLQPPEGYLSYADCFRTSASVSGISTDMGAQDGILKLRGIDVPIIHRTFAMKNYAVTTMAARARISFYLHAMPLFRTILLARPDAGNFTALTDSLVDIPSKSEANLNTRYRSILANPTAKALFETEYGINGSIVPEVGQAITQVNDDYEKGQAEILGEEKWNFHWAGVILKDGTDYITLENCAVELGDATAAENVINAAMILQMNAGNHNFNKTDQLNDRWYFRLYGQDDKSFHRENLASPNATPSAISLPMTGA